MAEFNRRQQDFLIDVIGKVVVYTITVVGIGILLEKVEIGFGKIIILVAGIISLVIFALELGKDDSNLDEDGKNRK